jgi:hypothetical protein
MNSFFASTDLLHLASRTCDHLAPFLGSIAWPLITLAIVWWFRKELVALIRRVTRIGAPGIDVFLEAMGDYSAQLSPTQSALDNDVGIFLPEGSPLHQVEGSESSFQIDAKKAGYVYFGSHDLMLCYFALISEGEKEMIVHTLTCAVDSDPLP